MLFDIYKENGTTPTEITCKEKQQNFHVIPISTPYQRQCLKISCLFFHSTLWQALRSAKKAINNTASTCGTRKGPFYVVFENLF